MASKAELTPSRRIFLHKAAQLVDQQLALVVLGAFVTYERRDIPDLGLHIDRQEWDKAVLRSPQWERLPVASRREDLVCSEWARWVCIGTSTTLYNVYVNRNALEVVMKSADVFDLPIQTSLIYEEWWGEKLPGTAGYEGGSTYVSTDNKNQDSIVLLRAAAHQTFLILEKERLPDTSFEGVLAFVLSVWTAHELGHAGKEFRLLLKSPNPVALGERLHPQIFAFQKEYEELVEQAVNQGRTVNALLVKAEPLAPVAQMREVVFREFREQFGGR